MKHSLPRGEVEGLLQQGHRWKVDYCWGSKRDPLTGAGMAALPESILTHVATPAALRKLMRGRANKTYFYVSLSDDEGEPLLRFEEG